MEEILADNAELSEIPWEFLKEPEMESPREVASMSLQPTFPSPRGSATTSRTRGFWSRTRGLGGLEPTVFRIRTMARFVHFSCHVTSGPKLGVNIPCVLNTPRGHPSCVGSKSMCPVLFTRDLSGFVYSSRCTSTAGRRRFSGFGS